MHGMRVNSATLPVSHISSGLSPGSTLVIPRLDRGIQFCYDGQMTHYICLLGPTAVGKTNAALQLAERFPQLSLISVDSALVYRGMNIGTGKPDPATLSRFPHQLVNIRDPWEPYSAADFRQDALEAIAAARAQGKIPFLVGGTFLYFKALQMGLSDLPAANAMVREEIQAIGNAQGWPVVHQLLAKVDPTTASRLSPNDRQRITRALEVYQLTQKPLSAWFMDAPVNHKAGEAKPGNNIISFILQPESRADLHQAIAARFHDMMQQGFLEEVKTLQNHPRIHPNLPAMRAVGYRQLIEYCVSDDSEDINSAIERGIAATRQLAKRQITWLRSLSTLPNTHTFTKSEDLIHAIADYAQR